uniref:CCR4-NOT transcription complex subunit 9 n=1 Tax=Araucaria cunninghamii TaxID=56994 RepID=A0A0D6R2F3_ARACU
MAMAKGMVVAEENQAQLNPNNNSSQSNRDRKMATAEQLVLELTIPEHRENALLDLSKKRELFQDLAPMLWHSFGTIAALLQCVASHPDTRTLFLNVQKRI